MRLTGVHVEFWQAKQRRPRWVRRALPKKTKGPADLIHACVNAHAGISVFEHHDADGLCNLIRMVRSHKDVADYLEQLMPGIPGNTNRRIAFARKWAARIRKSKETCRE